MSRCLLASSLIEFSHVQMKVIGTFAKVQYCMHSHSIRYLIFLRIVVFMEYSRWMLSAMCSNKVRAYAVMHDQDVSLCLDTCMDYICRRITDSSSDRWSFC